MLKLYTWGTPNGQKPVIMLEEIGLPYELQVVNIRKGEQREPEYLAMNPNGKIPTLVDDAAEGGPLTIFESGAILQYLGEKSGKLFPQEPHEKYATIEWLMFQMAGVGPMFGQAMHFIRFAPEKIEYGIERYTKEAMRLTGVLNTRLGQAEYLAGEYSIADIATWTWIRGAVSVGFVTLAEFPEVERWLKAIEARPAVTAALQKLDEAMKAAQPAS